VRVVLVKTLDASAGHQPYEATRTLWERRRFVQVDTIDPLPGWQPVGHLLAVLGPTPMSSPERSRPIVRSRTGCRYPRVCVQSVGSTQA